MRADPGRMIAALVLIVLGGAFLLGQFVRIDVFAVLWPFAIILPGVAFIAAAFGRDPKLSGFMFPGLIITATGVILLIQSLVNYWESWAYIWAIYPIMVGLAMMYSGQRMGRPEASHFGRGMVIVGTLLLIGFAGFFELFIFRGVGTDVVQYVVPLLLIGAGAWMLFTGRRSNKQRIGES